MMASKNFTDIVEIKIYKRKTHREEEYHGIMRLKPEISEKISDKFTKNRIF